jgi:hypothetical protein
LKGHGTRRTERGAFSFSPWLWEAYPQTRNPPRMTWGETESRFWGACRVRRLGLSFKTSQRITFGIPGFGGASVLLQPGRGWRKSVTPGEVGPRIARFEVWEVPSRRSRMTSSPGASLRPARSRRRCIRLFAESDRPSNQWTSHSAYPWPAWRTSLQFSTPKGLVSRCPARLVRPLTKP